MKKTLLICAIVGTTCFFSTAAKATWQEGVEAYENKNYAKAWEEFRPLENSPESKYFLYYMGRMTQLGLGTPKDVNKALTYYYKAAQNNDSRASVELGSMYFSGNDFPPDYATAKQWFQYAVKQGNPVAAYNLGIIYEEGIGEPVDLGKAFESYRFAADKGYEDAQKKVGLMMYEGYGTPQDYTTAIKYLIKAADQGNTEAMMTLGDCLSDTTRIGAPTNLMHAHKWYNIAAGYGTPEVRAEAIKKRDEIVAKMKPEEVLGAHKLARNWHPERTELNLSNIPEEKTNNNESKTKNNKKEPQKSIVPDILGEEDENSLMSSSLPSF